MYKYLLLRHDKNTFEKKEMVNKHIFYLACTVRFLCPENNIERQSAKISSNHEAGKM